MQDERGNIVFAGTGTGENIPDGGENRFRSARRQRGNRRRGSACFPDPHPKPGGAKLDASFDADDNLTEVELLRRQATFSYKDGEAFVFLDDEDYTPYTLDADAVGDAAGYIVDDLTGIYVQLIDDTPVAIQLPQSVAIEVVETPPELKGGTATKRPKPAKLATGIEIMVPEYIGNGEKVWVNTTTGEFAGRAD